MASLNARVSAVNLSIGSIATLALSFAPELVPLRFIALGLCLSGAWGLADEMGAQKPLNRAGLVAFGFAGIAQTLILLGASSAVIPTSSLLYAFGLLSAMLLWSIAFLHRDGALKLAGLVGASVTLVPIVALIAGHIFVAVAGVWGIGTLYEGLNGAATDVPRIRTIIDVVFVFWGLMAAAVLWTGQIKPS